VLNWFHEKIKVEAINKKKRGKKRYRVIDGEIDFTYREAAFRGLTSQKYSKALRELHKFGFIEVEKPGSALRGDWTFFKLSERWREFGTPNFRQVEFPKSVYWVNFGFGSKTKKKKS
jgi:hypothetical protein